MRIKKEKQGIVRIRQGSLISVEILNERLRYFFGGSPRTSLDIIIGHIHIERITGGIQPCSLVFRIALFHNIFDFRNQFRPLIIIQPFSKLTGIEIFYGKILILSHKISQLFG